MIYDSNSVSELIPQKKPFVMVHNLLEANEKELLTNFKVEEDNILCENGQFSTPGLIENIAQTCAAGFGYLAMKNNEEPKVGYIGSINKMKLYDNPKVGEIIETKINVVITFENITMIQGESYIGDKQLLSCEMKIIIA